MTPIEANKIVSERGLSSPLGASRKGKGINFALYSENATGVTLSLFMPDGKDAFIEIPLDPHLNKTGRIWHILVNNLPSEHVDYGYRVSGPSTPPGNMFNPDKVLLDPYAKGLNTGHRWGHEPDWHPRGRVILEAPFDWEGSKSPKIPLHEVIVYEMHVRAFTQDPSSRTKNPGTFLGIIEKIPYLKSLGVNAIELMPIFEFDECELPAKTDPKLKNLWGYSTINYFTPMNRYSFCTRWTSAMDDFRTLVKEMHKNGIEVYLDVVYNHTGEGNETGPFFSFKGIDNRVYYMVNPQGHYIDFSGTGNTLNANNPVVTQLILDSLRYWVSEMHIDGFRFDLASCLTRDSKGVPLSCPPVIDAIIHDPIIADVKLIAEAWDAGGLYQVGSFPSKGRWFEWNGKFRDVVRRYIKGTDGYTGGFAKVMSGSEDLYFHERKPHHSVNFVTAHDGFTLRDLVSYQNKHNEANGEGNRDGSNENDSWNCGHEGVTNDPAILHLREKQMRNLHVALMLAAGTPMVLMGDDYGHTKRGNNNTYCQDNELSWFLWDKLKAQESFVRFHRLMIQFRKTTPLLQRKEFLKDTDVVWHGMLPNHANWSHGNRFLAYTLLDPLKEESLYIAFNPQWEAANITLPEPPSGKKWFRVVDTSLPSPHDFCEDQKSQEGLKQSYKMEGYSALVAKAI